MGNDLISNMLQRVDPKQEYANNLRSKLFDFIRGLNIRIVEDGDWILDNKTTFKDVTSAFDTLQKFLVFRKDVTDREITLQTANILFTFLGKKSTLAGNLFRNIREWEGYDRVYKKYAKIETEDQVEDELANFVDEETNIFAHKQAIIHFLADALEKGVDPSIELNKSPNEDINKEYFSKRNYKNPYQSNKIKKLFVDLWNFINEYFFKNSKFDKLNSQDLNDLAMDIVDDVFKKDFSKFIRVYSKKGDKIVDKDGVEYETKEYEKTLNKDPFAKKIIESLFNNPFVDYKLSGSQVLRKYGRVLRSINEDLHDIDGVITLEQFKKEENSLDFLLWLETKGKELNQTNPTQFKKEIQKYLDEQSWYKNIKNMFPSWELTNTFIGKEHRQQESVTITGTVTSPEGKEYVLDFFLRTKEGNYLEIFDNYWKDWKQIFEAKLHMGRAKDLNDLIYFEPFTQDLNKFTNVGFRYFTFAEKNIADEKNLEDHFEKGSDNMFEIKDRRFDKKQGKNTEDVFKVLFGLNNEEDAYSNIGKSFTVEEVIKNIENTFDDSFSPIAQKLINKLKSIGAKSSAKIILVDGRNMPDSSYMDYNSLENVIRVPINQVTQDSTSYAVMSMLHEIVHSVTVMAYKKAKTTSEIELKNTIDEAFKYYKENTNLSGLYGFTNVNEFMAELYSNPVFQAEIKRIDESKKSNIFDRIITAIRRLLGLPVINGQNVVKAIVELSKDYGSIYDVETENDLNTDIIFAKKSRKSDKYYTDLSSIEKKLNFSLDNIENNIKDSLNSYRSRLNITKNDKKIDYIKEQIEQLEGLQADIAVLRSTNAAAAVVRFTDTMMKNLFELQKKIEDINSTIKEDKDIDVKDLIDSTNNYDNALTTYSIIDDLKDTIITIKNDPEQTVVDKDDLNKVISEINKAISLFSTLESELMDIKRISMAKLTSTNDYFPYVVKKFEDKARREGAAIGLRGNDLDDYVSDRILNEDAEEIKQAIEEEAMKLFNNPMFDIYASDKIFSSALNISNPMIQIFNKMIMDLDNQRIEEERIKDLEFKDAFDELVKEKGTKDIDKLYENITVKDSSGKTYLLGDYSIELIEVRKKNDEILKDYIKKRNTLRNKIKQAAKKGQKEKARNFRIDLVKITKEKNDKLKDLHSKYFEIYRKKIVKPLDKFKTDYSTLTPAEKKVLNLFKEITDTSNKIMFGNKQVALSKYIYPETLVYELPKVTKTDVERFWNADFKGIAQDKIDYFTKTRADETDYINQRFDAKGNQIKNLRLAYREYDNVSWKESDQSLDLMTIYRLEYKNTNRFKLRRNIETELSFMIDIAKHSKFYVSSGSRKVLNKDNNKLAIQSNTNSNLVQMMENILESRLYDIAEANQIKWGKVDLNKATKFINSSSAFLALSLNIASATANVVNANAQMFLETYYKGYFFTKKDLAIANKVYGEHLLDSIADVTNPIKTSYVNQILEMFNIRGLYNLSNADFFKTTILKAGLSINNLQILQDSGEHWIQSVATLAMLNNIKVKNNENKWIDKEGNVVKREKAASLLDMLKQDEETGIVRIDSRVGYTSHSTSVRWYEGGKTQVDSLLIKKMYDIIGNYRQTDQPEIMRHWYGKLLLLYRKYLVPMGIARFRGIEHASSLKGDLEDYQKRFSYALLEYEEGSYTTLIRYLSTALQDKKKEILSFNNWNALSEYEKNNIRKAVGEIVLTTVLLPLAVMFVGAVADGEDDDYLFFLAYQLRRLETELSAYRNPSETFKMLRSPIPSTRLLESGLDIMSRVARPWTWNEVYKSGPNKDRNKLLIKTYKQIPVIKETLRKYQDLFEYQNSAFGIR